MKDKASRIWMIAIMLFILIYVIFDTWDERTHKKLEDSRLSLLSDYVLRNEQNIEKIGLILERQVAINYRMLERTNWTPECIEYNTSNYCTKYMWVIK